MENGPGTDNETYRANFQRPILHLYKGWIHGWCRLWVLQDQEFSAEKSKTVWTLKILISPRLLREDPIIGVIYFSTIIHLKPYVPNTCKSLTSSNKRRSSKDQATSLTQHPQPICIIMIWNSRNCAQKRHLKGSKCCKSKQKKLKGTLKEDISQTKDSKPSKAWSLRLKTRRKPRPASSVK